MRNQSDEVPILMAIFAAIGFSALIFGLGWMMTSFAHSLKEGAIAAETAYKNSVQEASDKQAARCHSLGGSVVFGQSFLFKECIVTVTPK